ncbi:MAG TPA: T9SS type A sorting domain-containing protein, partial [bacterium]|nr:T9SS type A sorting domain-containing protein [bacterium]
FHFSVYGAFSSSVLSALSTNLNNAVIYPNPYVPYDNNDRNGIEYSGADDGGGIYFAGLALNTKIEIFDISGKLVFDCVFNDASKSYYQWNVRNNKGTPLASGIYVVSLSFDGHRKIKKIGIIK